ncbi:hypothetical protein [Ectothiorhodospira lacustris]|uniref:hypothetical protein n=1 Tax=Ectothiorhodospira lacustris TaxID=2899127 RepID=UPI001EE90584|nr:hypothetical protein [Ectothiorhodospira lacustris]MCG5499579.1 hypothetical protein [Ectothiorhodospira lacustris]MCG5508727.1 hypothetical protein [Ectothiorhodospira lacustris]MCG5520518.1 hypothetical protein [Ectothiorhodospira lacustris]
MSTSGTFREQTGSRRPTIQSRLDRRFIVMTARESLLSDLDMVAPIGWTRVVATELAELGDWNDILLHRFVLLDLEGGDAFDPLDVIRMLRTEYQINIPVFCFGGDEDLQDQMRLARADRFFTRDEMLDMLPDFFEQYGWGG